MKRRRRRYPPTPQTIEVDDRAEVSDDNEEEGRMKKMKKKEKLPKAAQILKSFLPRRLNCIDVPLYKKKRHILLQLCFGHIL